MKRKPIKGKVPRTDWAGILERHNRGEPLAKIGADYGCTAPAISYIVRRVKQQQEGAAVPGRHGSLPETAVAARHSARISGRLAPTDAVPPDGSYASPAVGGARRWFDSALQQKISDDIASFLVAFDSAINSGTEQNCDVLLEASERLMRAAARTRIELARLRPRGTEIEPPLEGTGADVSDVRRRRV